MIYLKKISPTTIILLTFTLSAMAWIVPESTTLRKGFDTPYYPNTIGELGLIFLYLFLIFFGIYLGKLLGVKYFKELDVLSKYSNLESTIPYFFLSFISSLGVIYVIWFIISNIGIAGVSRALERTQGNTFRDLIYDNYAIGLFSLRYVAILSGALALYKIKEKKLILLNVWNIICLLLMASLSSRLSLASCLLIYYTLISKNLNVKVNLLKVFIFSFVAINLFFLFNYLRNFSYYSSVGSDSFYEAGLSEALSYLGTPFQGFLKTVEVGDTFFGADQYTKSSITSIDFSLNTNSAYMDLTSKFSQIAVYPIIFITCIFFSALCYIGIKNKNNILFLLYGISLYCFAEMWRLYIFGQGIIITLFAFVILSAVIPLLLLPILKKYHRLRKL